MAKNISSSPFGGVYSFLESCTGKFSWLSHAAMAVLPILVFLDVSCRLFGKSVPGSLELQENILALTTFSFMALLQLRDRHMQIDFLYNRYSVGVQRW
ncbi:MAG: TRAP transporter small permease subunit [Mailhella sp.]|nr:TRAP transporter small permease subunit [Mailhella sp.]